MKKSLIGFLLVLVVVGIAAVHYSGNTIDASNYANLAAAIADIGSTKKTLVISNSQTLTASATFPSTLTLKVLRSGMIVKASTYVVIINGPLEAGLYQIFSGFTTRADVTFGAGTQDRIRPIWWGCAGDGSTNDLVAFQMALDSLVNGKHTFETETGKDYKLGAAGRDSIYLYADDVTYNFGTSTFIGAVVVGDFLGTKSDIPEDWIINGGHYTALGAVGTKATRYTATQNNLTVLVCDRGIINNPKCTVSHSGRGIVIQTSSDWGSAPYKNIQNLSINSPVIVNDVNGIDGIHISDEDNSERIENVSISNAIITGLMNGITVTTGSPVYDFNSISITDFQLRNITDLGIYVTGARNSTFSGTIDGVAWRGASFYNCKDTIVPYMNIVGAHVLAAPPGPGAPGIPFGLDANAGTTKAPIVFGTVSIIGANAANGMWDVGLVADCEEAVYHNVFLKNCDIGIDNSSEIQTFYNVTMDNCTTQVHTPAEPLTFIQSLTTIGASSITNRLLFNQPTTFTDSDTTPSVATGNFFLTNTTGVTILRFDDGIPGQQITVVSKGAVVFDTSPADRLIGSSVDITTASGDTSIWICEVGGTTSSVWRLIEWVDVSADNS